MISIEAFAATIIGLLGIGFTWHKYAVSRRDKGDNQIDDLQDDRLNENRRMIDQHNQRLNKHDEMFVELQQHISSEFASKGETGKLAAVFEKQMQAVHERLSGIARDLNKTIGKMEQAQDDRLSTIISEIKSALERKRD